MATVKQDALDKGGERSASLEANRAPSVTELYPLR